MGEQRCRYCQRVFQPSKFQPRQAVCGGDECQRKRRTDYHRNKIASDPEYREVCRDSPRKWRARNPDYWRRYRENHPATSEHNRQRQKLRDRMRKLRILANNTSALDLKHCAAEVWLWRPGMEEYSPVLFVNGRRFIGSPASLQYHFHHRRKAMLAARTHPGQPAPTPRSMVCQTASQRRRHAVAAHRGREAPLPAA